MRKIVACTILLLLLCPTQSWAIMGRKVVRYYYPSGELMREVPHKKGKRNGVEKRYDKEGHIVGQVPYRNGVIQGVQKAYFPDGTLSGEWPHKADKRHGTSVTYFPDKTVKTKTQFYKGKQQGLYKHYYLGGAIQYIVSYVYDKQHGAAVYYDKEGHLTARKFFFQNECLSWNKYDKKGTMIKDSEYEARIEKYAPVDIEEARIVTGRWLRAFSEFEYDLVLPLMHLEPLIFEGTQLPNAFRDKVKKRRLKVYHAELGTIIQQDFVSARTIPASTKFPPCAILEYRIQCKKDTARIALVCDNKNKEYRISHVFFFPQTEVVKIQLDKALMQEAREERSRMPKILEEMKKAEDHDQKAA